MARAPIRVLLPAFLRVCRAWVRFRWLCWRAGVPAAEVRRLARNPWR